MDKTILGQIQAIVSYAWEEERNDYRDNCGDGPDDNQREGHIFETLQAVQAWLNDQESTNV